MKFLIFGIITAFAALFLLIYGCYFINGKNKLEPIISLMCSIPLGLLAALLLRDYQLPHHGEQPTIKHVNSGDAYIDTTKIINNNDTTYYYSIKWK